MKKDAKKRFTRATFFTIAVCLIFLIIIGRLFQIQIVKGDYYKSLAEEKGEKEIIDPAPRGEILDANGEKIATSKQGYNIVYSNYQNQNQKSESKTKEERDREINKSLLETIRIIGKTNPDKLNLSAIPIVLENDKYVYNFTATSESLKAKQKLNFKKSKGIDVIEKKLSKEKGTTVSLNIDEVVTELEKKYGIIDEQTGKKTLQMTKLENYQLLAVRAAVSELSYSQYKTIYIAKNVDKEVGIEVMTKESELSGISSEVSPIRYYPNGEVGSSFIGYLGKVDEASAEEYKSLGYDINRELVGKLGLERSLESNSELGINLRGEPGVKYINVDKLGKVTKETAALDPIPGDTVKTSIIMDLQKVTEEALDRNIKSIGGASSRGAAIVTNIKTGEILALASRPGFNPNDFAETGSISDMELYRKYFVPEKNEGDKYDTIAAPMFNYATKGAVPPGSIFKPFTGIIGLEEGVIKLGEEIFCGGRYEKVDMGANTPNCWIFNQGGGSHGMTSLQRALGVSCNIYFYEVGRRLGEEKFSKWVTKFGLATDPETGERPKSGIEIEESPGAVGTDQRFKDSAIVLYLNDITKVISEMEYGGYTITKGTEEYNILQEMFKSVNYKVETLNSIGISNKKAQSYIKMRIANYKSSATGVGQVINASIGQGSSLLTPLQMIGALNTLLNDGKRYSTHLVKEVLNADGSVKKEVQPKLLGDVKIKPENKQAILEGMSNVTGGENGTAASTFRGFSMKTGGKTGSASVSGAQRENGRRAYGWFMGFAPYDNPEISVIVVIYDADSGGKAAPVARSIYEEYFGMNKDKKEAEKEEKAEENPENTNENAVENEANQEQSQN